MKTDYSFVNEYMLLLELRFLTAVIVREASSSNRTFFEDGTNWGMKAGRGVKAVNIPACWLLDLPMSQSFPFAKEPIFV